MQGGLRGGDCGGTGTGAETGTPRPVALPRIGRTMLLRRISSPRPCRPARAARSASLGLLRVLEILKRRRKFGRVRHAIGRVRHTIGRVQAMHSVASDCDACVHESWRILAQSAASISARLAVEWTGDGTDESIDDPPALRLAAVGKHVPYDGLRDSVPQSSGADFQRLTVTGPYCS